MRRALVGVVIGMLAMSHAIASTESKTLESAWITGSVGASFASMMTLTSDANDSDLVLAGDPTPAFTVGLHYRTPRLDVGFMAGGVGSGNLRTPGQSRSAGHKLRLAPWVRWRYVDAAWGSLFLRMTPAITFLDHSDPMRAAVVELNGRSPDFFPVVETNSVGFSFGASLGVLVNITSWLLLYLDVEVITTVTNIEDGTNAVGYTAVQPVFATGFEARL